MSTIALNYPNTLSAQRNANIRRIIVLIVGLILVATVILVAAVASVKVDSSSGVVAVPIPVAPAVNAQIQPAVTATPAASPVVIAVPVATPPSQ
jgi:hypothetical protein